MNQINWLNVFNSFTTFGVLSVIAIGILVLISKKEVKSKPQKQK